MGRKQAVRRGKLVLHRSWRLGFSCSLVAMSRLARTAIASAATKMRQLIHSEPEDSNTSTSIESVLGVTLINSGRGGNL